MSENNDMEIPTAGAGEAADKAGLLALAQKHNVLRLSAENGLSYREAIAIIQNFYSIIAESSLPKKHYSLLK